ncbi:MAG: rod shape-determining protein MreC [Clostridia bacterium]|nr:rod shape-determining protein MreC [Clostridia bacterium]
MKELLAGKNFRALIVVVVVMIVLMLYSAASGGRSNIFSTAFSLITSPVQRLTSKLTGAAEDLNRTYGDPKALSEENEALKARIRELNNKLVDYEDVKRENETLKEVLGLKEENADFDFVPATVISRDTTDSSYPFTIDKGSSSGVSLYDPIMTADGLVGYVSEVGLITSKVTTILNSTIDVGAFDRRTRDNGVISGTSSLAKKGYTKLGLLQRDCDVSTGDIIVSSGLGGIFPDNVVIGEVMEVNPEPQSISLYAVVKPMADIAQCRDVFVLVDFSGQGTVVDTDSISGETDFGGEGETESTVSSQGE